MTFEIVNPLEIPDWDDLVLATGKASVFHSSAWAKVLHECYGYRPVYFASFDNGNLSSLMPFMEINSWLTGKRGVSLPFSDFCESFADGGLSFDEAVKEVREYGRKNSWKTVEWRGNQEHFETAPPSAVYRCHALDLSVPEERAFSNFKSNTRRNINKAIKKGVRVDLGETLESVAGYYRLHCLTRRGHGRPPQPFSFFRKIFEHIISKGGGFTALAFLDGVCLAGAVYLHLGRTAIFKFGASNRKYQHLRPNNLVMWEAIRECAKRGFQTLSLGRTEPDNEGLLQFKRGWGTTEARLHYHLYDLKRDRFVADGEGRRIFRKAFQLMPSPLLKIAGNVLYKHAG
jgi:hypothetical protein